MHQHRPLTTGRQLVTSGQGTRASSNGASLAELRAATRQALEEGRQLAQEAAALLRASPADPQQHSALLTALDRFTYRAEALAGLDVADEDMSLENAAERRGELEQIVAGLRAALERERPRLEAAQREQEQRRLQLAALAADVRARVDPGLAERRQAVQAALAEAEADVAEARGRVEAHERTAPADRAAAAAWARELGQLRDELAGYELLAGRAREAAEAADGAERAAEGQAWEQAERAARAELSTAQAEGDAAVAAAEAALLRARQDRAERVAAAEGALALLRDARKQ